MPIVETKKTAIDFLAEYLSPYEKFGPDKIHLTRVDDNYINGNWQQLTVRSHYFNYFDDHYVKRLLSYDDDGTLLYYLDDTSNPSHWKYYRRKAFMEGGETVYKYRREDVYISDTWVSMPDVPFKVIDLEEYTLHGKHSVYFGDDVNAMYLKTVREVEIMDGIPYDSDDMNIPNNHEYKMAFIDEEGWGDSGWDQFWKMMFNGIFNALIDNADRKLHLAYSPGSGKIPVYPQLIRGSDLRPYSLVYRFLDGNQDPQAVAQAIYSNAHLFRSLEQGLLENAIKIDFKTIYGLLGFTKFLYFHSGFNSTITKGDNKNRMQFFDAYSELVKDTFRELKHKTDELFKFLYFLPSGAIKLVGKEELWDFIGTVVQDALTNIKTDKEDIVVKILETLGEMYPETTDFLSELVDRKIDKIPLLEHLTYRLDGYNFTKFVELVRSKWKKSDYASLDENVNPILNLDGTSPILLPYKSDKTLGFHHDNATIAWTNSYEAILVIVREPVIQVEGNAFEEALADYATFMTQAYLPGFYAYHPFAPMAILSEDNPEFIFNDAEQQGSTFQIMPAFVLFAREQRAFWSNLATAAEYAADILSFMSGYGNILKAGKLFKAFKLGEKLILKSKTFTKLAIGVRKASGYMEMTAGVGNALLKLTGARETELGRKISEVLFYLEMAALTGEISAALHGSIKKASQEALQEAADINKVIENAQEIIRKNIDTGGNLKKTKEVLEAQDDLAAIRQLEEFAGISNVGRHMDSVRLTKLELEEWKKVISSKGGRIRNISESKKMQKYFDEEQVGAAFSPFEVPPAIWIRNNASDLELFHESMHFEDFLRRGERNFKRGTKKEVLPFGNAPQPTKRDQLISDYIKEKYVLERILQEQQDWINKYGYGRFTDQEIGFSKLYFADYELDCILAGIDISKIVIKPL